MRRYQFLQLDVFTSRLFGGNQLAVFPAATGLSDTEMQAIAKEMNFSETTFVLPATDIKALCRVRIFTPGTELPLAGHPVVGTTFALAHQGQVRASDPSPIFLELGVGTLPVDVLFDEQQLSFAWMHQPVPVFEPWQGDRDKLAAALGLAPEDFAPELPIEHGSAGVPYLYIPLRTREALAQARPVGDLTAALNDPAAQVGAYVFTLGGASAAPEARARMFAPEMGIVEDAATGSAAGPLGVYLLRHGHLAPDQQAEARLRIEQGVEMGRPSRIEVAITGSVEDVRDVRVGGEAVIVAEGTLMLLSPEQEQ
ncbi:MAG TPA: PhzF family phenazine biosynthesis protein [Ktedonobacterales bacterium]|nr:PhzF family phenazine biosynthesis protein [Ktedonobacterales bacterium]